MTQALLSIWGVSSVLMLALWFVWRKTRRTAAVDVMWAFCVWASVVMLCLVGDGAASRRWLCLGLAGVWAGRLSLFLLRDRLLRHKEEDGRYTRMLSFFGARAELAMFVFFQMQAVFVVLFALPVAAVSFGDGPAAFDLMAALGLAIGVGAIVGEAVADWQLSVFRRDPATRGTTCRRGLWKYSRHPNYFFEWLFWFAFIGLAWGSSTVWLAAVGPIIVFAFLYRFTGIPYTEKQALSHRPDYAEYQRVTPMFFPGRPRRQT